MFPLRVTIASDKGLGTWSSAFLVGFLNYIERTPGELLLPEPIAALLRGERTFAFSVLVTDVRSRVEGSIAEAEEKSDDAKSVELPELTSCSYSSLPQPTLPPSGHPISQLAARKKLPGRHHQTGGHLLLPFLSLLEPHGPHPRGLYAC